MHTKRNSLDVLYGLLFLIITPIFFTGCANYKLHISNNKPSSSTDVSPQSERISHSVFLLGDAGDTKKSPATIELLKKHLETATKQSSLIFLGDNLYPNGVPPKTDKAKRKSAEEILDAQLRILQNYKGRPIFIPGNHDWERYRLKGLHRQEKYIESQLNQGIEDEEDWTNYFMPDRGCPGPEIIEVNEKLVILLIDTEWWLMNWNLEPNINEGCGISNRGELGELIEDAIKEHRNKNIIIATHHPMRTTGPHGGKFTFKEHIFPITMASKDFYLPLPVLGSLVIGIRNSGVIRQDLNHKNYRELEKTLVGIAQKYGSFIFVSGHEHSLQYHQDKGQHFIVSGAGSKATATAATNKTMFSYGNLGFSKIDVYKDGSVWVEFWVPEENSALGKRVYRYKMKDALKAPKPAEIPTSFPEYDQKLSSKTVFPIKTQVKQTKKTETFMLGHHYRNIYLEKYEFPVLDLSTYKGGFRILKKGGGKQTNSLRMINPAGKEYVLRSLTKDVSRTVPYPFNQMPLINYLFIDNFLGTHPFAPLVIGDLADAAKVYHTNPQIYYVPKQPALGSYNDMFGGEVYLFEERPSKSWPDLASFGNAVKFSNSYDLIDKMEKNNKHRVDQKWAARSRIFDVLIGDWDRHEDQWRWTVTQDEGGYKLYRPIPRDRDQAFSKYDGFAIKILSPYNVFLHQISDYDDKMNNFKWNTYNSRHFDNTFLNELDLEDWKNEASYIKEHLTDEVIEDAFKNLPPKVYDLSAEQIMTVLKSRRDKLQIIAEGMYEELAQKVTIVGTEKKDYFEIIRKENGETEINRYDSNKKGEKKERLYHRVFKDSETRSVFIYGLGDDDIFHMSGKADRGFRIHLMGAHGDDTYIDESKVSGAGKKHKIHDTKTGNKLQLGTESKDLTSNVVVNNQYDRHGKQNDENMFFAVPLVGFNGDDGIFIGATTYSQINVFTKNPYGQYHKIGATYAFATKALDIEYNGEFIQIAKKWDLLLNGNIRGDRYAFNFFGLGNETERIEDDINFYRVQQSMGYVDIGFQRRFASDLGRFTLRSSLQGNDIADTENRFIDGDDTGLDEKHFENRLYLGFISSISLASVDNEISPRNGFRFNSELHHRTNLSGSSRQFVTFGTDFTLYQSFGNKRSPITLASRIGTELIRGDYDFFFAPSLGQKQNLRGFPRDRFRGATSMFHTTDLRVPIAASNNPILPMTIGIFGSFDYGRVWEPNEDSGLWHSSFGGGLLLFPLNMFVLSLNVHRSNEDIRFRVSIKHSF